MTANSALPAPVAHPPSAETDDGVLSNTSDGIAPNSSVSFSSASIMSPVYAAVGKYTKHARFVYVYLYDFLRGSCMLILKRFYTVSPSIFFARWFFRSSDLSDDIAIVP